MTESMACEKSSTRHLTAHDQDILNVIFNQTGAFDEEDILDDNNQKSEEETELGLTAEARQLELEGVRAAEAGDAQTALRLFTEVIRLTPDRPAGYNNRAQAHRINQDVQSAEEDLDKTIILSKGQGQAACQAFTQRGLLRRLRDDTAGATEDFQNAARLGSHFAKTQLVALNPYAQLCGAMVAEMLEMERRGGNNNTANS